MAYGFTVIRQVQRKYTGLRVQLQRLRLGLTRLGFAKTGFPVLDP